MKTYEKIPPNSQLTTLACGTSLPICGPEELKWIVNICD